MKKIAILLAMLFFVTVSAQIKGFNYKALITDQTGVLSNQSVNVQFSILQSDNTMIYQETQTATTDANGIISLHVGEGNVISGDFASIDWASDNYKLKVEVDTGSGFIDMGTSDFKSVPYAKFADKAGNVFSGEYADLNNAPILFHLTGQTHQAYSLTDNMYHTGKLAVGTTDADAEADQQFFVKTQHTSVGIGDDQTDHNAVVINSDLEQGNALYVKQNSAYNLASKSAVQAEYTDKVVSKIAYYDKSAIRKGYYGMVNVVSDMGNVFGVGVFNKINGDTQTSTIGCVSEVTNDGTGPILGDAKILSGHGDGDVYGDYNAINTFGNGQQFGVNVSINNHTGQGDVYGGYYNIRGNGTGKQFGVMSLLDNNATGLRYGVYNDIKGNATNKQFGVYNKIAVSNNRENYGIYNLMIGTGTGIQYGTYNRVVNTSNTNWHYGSFNYLENGGNKTGTHNSIVNDQSTSALGTNNLIGGAGDGNCYGSSNMIINTGTGDKFGSYNYIPITAGGRHFAVYGKALKNAPDVYAGYFEGEVHVKSGNLTVENRLTSIDSGNADLKAYIYGSITSGGMFSSNGASTDGFTIDKTGTGVYKINFENAPGNSGLYTVMTSMRFGNIGFITVRNYDSFFVVYTYNKDGVLANKAFNFVVYKK